MIAFLMRCGEWGVRQCCVDESWLRMQHCGAEHSDAKHGGAEHSDTKHGHTKVSHSAGPIGMLGVSVLAP